MTWVYITHHNGTLRERHLQKSSSIANPGTLQRLVKTAQRLHVHDARHIELFLDEHPDRASAGVLLYGADEIHPLTDRVIAVPWTRMI